MSKKVYIPLPLQNYTGSKNIVDIDGATVGEVLDNLTNKFFRLRKHLYSENGKIRSFINVYVNNDDIKFLQDEQTELNEEDVIRIIPTITGGSN